MASTIDRAFLAEDVAVFVDGLLREGDASGLPKARQWALSRERNGHKYHWLVDAITDIRCLPEHVADALVMRLVDEVEARRSPVCPTEIPRLQVEEQQDDGEEDVAGVLAMQDPAKEYLHEDRLVRLAIRQQRLIRAYRAKREGRYPPKPSRWRAQTARAS